MSDPRAFVLGYLERHGPSVVPDIAETASADDFGLAKAERFRQALAQLEREGVVRRAGRGRATGLDGRRRGGPKPWIWALSEAAPLHGRQRDDG